MDCDWTEKISLLIDGELPREEARAAERHLEGCGACGQARADFLLLRGRLSAYQSEPDLVAQRRALRSILAAGRAAEGGEGLTGGRGWRGRLASILALPRLNPALAAAAALVLVGAVVGLLLLRRPQPVEVASGGQAPAATPQAVRGDAPVTGTNTTANSNAGGTAAGVSREGERAGGKVEGGTGGGAVVTQARGGAAGRPSTLRADARRAVVAVNKPRMVQRLKLPVTPKLDMMPNEALAGELASASGGAGDASDLDAARHVEQAQMLLRSVRNAELAPAPKSGALAYERGRSRQLLYRNMVLRREAERRGDAGVASVLDSLEPILMDIANLPDRPARGDVLPITERMRKKQIVAMLQVAGDARIY